MSSTPVMEKSARIYVAGGDTLIGAALLRHLAAEGYTQLFGRLGEAPDATDVAAVQSFFASVRPEFVFHAGGRSGGIAANMRFPADLIHDNLLQSVLVIEAARRHGVKKLLYLASSCSYPRDCAQPMRECDLGTGPVEPTSRAYALAKLAGIELCRAYRQQYGVDFIVGIPANAFGVGDDFDLDASHVIAALLRRFHEARERGDEALTVWGTGAARREFVYADDLAVACMLVMQSYSDAEPINLGGGGDVSIRELAEIVQRVVGFRGRMEFDSTKPDGMPLKALDGRKLAALGWRPTLALKDAIALTYESYLETLR